MSTAVEPVIYVLDQNVGNETDDPNDPYNAGRIAVGVSSSGRLRTLKSHQRRPDGVEVFLDGPRNGKMFWTQMNNPRQNDGIVQSSDLEGNNVTDVFPEGVIHTPKQLTIDTTTKKLYVCDREGLRVHRANLDGAEREVLIRTGDWTDPAQMAASERWCVGVCVDTQHGYFYWTQKGPSKGGKGRIFRAGIEMPEGDTASTRTDIETLFEDLPEPIDLHIDPESQFLYWTDRGDLPKGNTLNRASVAGNCAEIQEAGYNVLARHLHEAIGLQVDNQNKHIYVSDMGGDVYRYNQDGSDVVKLFEGQGVFTGIAVAHLSVEERRDLYGL